MSFFKGIKNLFAVSEDPVERDIAKVKNLVMDMIFYSESETDENEIQQHQHWLSLIKKHCRFHEDHGITAHLIMYKQAGHCGESWAEYEKRLDIESRNITIERVKYWERTDAEFYNKHIRKYAKELGKIDKKNSKGFSVKDDSDKKEYTRQVKEAA